jgi:tetratricopeptide (TPR) repeat protein
MKTWLPLILFVPIFVIVLVAMRLLAGRGMPRSGVLQAQLAAYQRGDYQAQLKIIEGFRIGGSEPAHYLFFRGGACFQLGRLGEAEQVIRRSMSMETNPVLSVLCQDQLGHILMEQGRWDEAAACFQDSILESPKRGGGHRAIAEGLLRHSGRNEAALDAARLAVAADRAKTARGRLGKLDRAVSLSESLAFLAWALAKNRADPTEVESALKEAFALCGETTKPVLAELHFCAGRAYADLGNTNDSIRHFKSATEIDPIGNYGRLSRLVGATG